MFERRGAYPLPQETGAVGRFGPFGTWVDATDLVTVANSALDRDPGLAALAQPLPELAGALLAFASDGPLRLEQVAGPLEAPERFEAMSLALRWLLWRRRVYTGAEDDLLLQSSTSWMVRVQRPHRPVSEHPQVLVGEYAIPEGDYANLDLGT